MLSDKKIICPNNLINVAKKLGTVDAAIVNAGEIFPMESVYKAVECNLINPTFVGNKNEIKKYAGKLNWDISKYKIIDEKDENSTAPIAAKLASENKVKIIVKGHIHTDILMKAVLKRDLNLIGKKRLSHVWHMTLDKSDKPFIITDGALNVLPKLETKMHILKNSIEFAKRIGINRPKVSVLSATEEILESVPSSIEAKEITRRAEEESFPTENIVLLSANHKDPENYRKWCKENNIKKPINWILLDWCEKAISSDYEHLTETFEDNFNYKVQNIDKLKHYLCLMRRWKMPRVFHHMALNYFNLLEKGSVSAILAKWEIRSVFKDIDRTKMEMANAGEVTFSDCATEDDMEFNKTLKDFTFFDLVVDEYQTRLKPELTGLGTSKFLYKIRSQKNVEDFLLKLPLTIDKNHFDALDSFHHWDSSLYKDTIFSYVYETWSYSTNMVFYSEKIYKCILNFHPFLTWANPDTIKYLNQNGYKTFSPYIDENYDTKYDIEERSTLLLKEMMRLCDMSIKDLLNCTLNIQE